VKKEIAFFDFDGTITKKDTLLEVIKFQKGNSAFYKGFFLLSPYLVAMKINILSNQVVKEKVLKYFFGGISVNQFQKKCSEFSEKILPQLIRPAALEMIHELRQKNFEVIIVSASPNNWFEDWCKKNHILFISTTLEVIEGKITGKILGRNCHGEEKVKRIKQSYNLSEYETIYCFGDTKGDKPMLKLATHAVYKPFRT
jgi:phosphatidylglycerophosphatase C